MHVLYGIVSAVALPFVYSFTQKRQRRTLILAYYKKKTLRTPRLSGEIYVRIMVKTLGDLVQITGTVSGKDGLARSRPAISQAG